MYATTYEALKHCAEEGRCINCGEKFSDENVFTPAGWRETKLSGLCEACFDNLLKKEDEYDQDFSEPDEVAF